MLRKILNYFHNRRVEKEQKLRNYLSELEDKCAEVCIEKENLLYQNEYMSKVSVENAYRDYERTLGHCIGSTLVLLDYDEDGIQYYSDQLRQKVIFRVEKHLGRGMVFK